MTEEKDFRTEISEIMNKAMSIVKNGKYAKDGKPTPPKEVAKAASEIINRETQVDKDYYDYISLKDIVEAYTNYLKGYDVDKKTKTKLEEDIEYYLQRKYQKLLGFVRAAVRPLTLKDLVNKYWVPLRGLNYYGENSFMRPWKVNALAWISTGIWHYLQSDFDFIALVNGLEGMGKSSLAIRLAYYLKALGLGFNAATHIFFKNTPEEYILAMIENTEKQVFIFDEARAHFWKRTFSTKGQRSRIEAITFQRARNHVMLLCTRQPDDIDVDLRDSRVAATFFIVDRGVAAFLINKNVGVGGSDPFGFNKIRYESKKRGLNFMTAIQQDIMKLPSFVSLFKFGKLPEETYLFYKRLKLALNKAGEELKLVVPTKEQVPGKAEKIMKEIIKDVLKDEAFLQKEARKLGVEKSLLKAFLLSKLGGESA